MYIGVINIDNQGIESLNIGDGVLMNESPTKIAFFYNEGLLDPNVVAYFVNSGYVPSGNAMLASNAMTNPSNLIDVNGYTFCRFGSGISPAALGVTVNSLKESLVIQNVDDYGNMTEDYLYGIDHSSFNNISDFITAYKNNNKLIALKNSYI